MPQGEVRIIGGEWRGRKLKVPALAGLRPTPDRVRETVFNWLMPVIQGAYCLDAFAGSGAMGFEALSRGAAHVVMVDQSLSVVQGLQQAAQQFKATNAAVYCAVMPEQLKKPAQPFDIVFLDPPYQGDLLVTTCHFLEAHAFLARESYIYLESSTGLQENDLPTGWQLIKSKKTGQVVYQLVRRQI